MNSRTSAILCTLGLVLALPLRAADLSSLIPAAARYESGQSAAPIQALEQVLRDSAGNPALRAELEAGMLQLLAPGTTFEARRFACQQLAVIGTEASLPALAGLLNQEETAGIACLALGAQRSSKAAEILRQALATARGAARLQIIVALGNQGDGQSVPALAVLAREADDTLACAALFALGKIGGKGAREAIAAVRKENRPGVAAAVAEATLCVAEGLAAAGDQQAATILLEELLVPTQPVQVRRGAFATLLRIDADGGETRILETLHGQEAALKPAAIAAVGTLKSNGASKKFAAELAQLAPQEQTWMIDSLAARGDAAARDAIRRAAGSPEALVRSAAVAALGRLSDGDSAALLCGALVKAQSASEREEIAAALGQLRGPATDEAILAELKRAGGDAKRELISLAGRRGNPAAVPVLLEEAGSDDTAIATDAFEALGRLATAEDLPALLNRLVGLRLPDARPEAERAAARALRKIENPARRTELVLAAMAGASTLEGRRSLLGLLPEAGDAKALATVKATGADADPAIREAAVRALAAWPDDSSWEALLAICRQPESAMHRALAFRGLARLAGELNTRADAALIGRYRQLLTLAGNPAESKLVLGALAGVASPDALPLALEQLSNAAVRAEAAEAVKKIATAIRGQHPQAALEALRRLAPEKN